MTRRAQVDPTDILIAAERVIERVGMINLTIDAVANEVGLSKGGVLHHFGTKDALIAAMVIRVNQSYKASKAKVEARNVGNPFSVALDHIDVLSANDKPWESRAAALFASLVHSPGHQALAREFYRETSERLVGRSPETVVNSVALLAAEGAFWLRGLGLIEVTDEQWQRMLEDIVEVMKLRPRED